MGGRSRDEYENEGKKRPVKLLSWENRLLNKSSVFYGNIICVIVVVVVVI